MKPTAILDKSVFQRICSQHGPDVERDWNALAERFTIIIPLILIEEVVADAVEPKLEGVAATHVMLKRLFEMRATWMEDVHEAAARELMTGRAFTKLQALNRETVDSLLDLWLDDTNLAAWVSERKLLRKETANDWRREQARLGKAAIALVLPNEGDFLKCICRYLNLRLTDSIWKTEFMDTVLGQAFRRLYPNAGQGVDDVILPFGTDKIDVYPLTFHCLITRLCYFFAPAITINRNDGSAPTKLIRSGGQYNSGMDEQYVISALTTQRLVTGDRGMRRIMAAFEQVGYWKGRTEYVDPNQPLASQIAGIGK